jgi:glycosyltransferase involved in cell wall biosynthesis
MGARGTATLRDMLSRLAFITAIPLSVTRGSGCYVGISTLAQALERRGVKVEWITPRVHLPVYAAERVLFNESLRRRSFSKFDAVVGFDVDGYTLSAAKTLHVANIKGVLGDAVPFERGPTRWSMALQARLEALHVRRADRVITISRYCAARIQELYGVSRPITIVPELIDLQRWRALFQQTVERGSGDERFRVLCVCRFYPRKRVHLLLGAAAQVRDRIPELELRIVGGGIEAAALRKLARELRLEPVVRWLGDASESQLATEYRQADLFCLPSVQEGFGIVLLEAMAAGTPILATRSAAVPEVAPHAVLVEPNRAEALAEGLIRLHRDEALRKEVAAKGLLAVEQYESGKVALQFLDAIESNAYSQPASK